MSLGHSQTKLSHTHSEFTRSLMKVRPMPSTGRLQPGPQELTREGAPFAKDSTPRRYAQLCSHVQRDCPS